MTHSFKVRLREKKSNVVSLHGGPPSFVRTPNAEFVAELEELLEKAQSGEVVGGVMAYQYFDRTTGYTVRAVTTNMYGLIGAVEKLKRALVDQV